MTVFWLGATLLVAITLALLVPPLLGRGRWSRVDRDRLNVGLYQDRLAELERELASDEMTKAQFEAARGELQRDLLNTTSSTDANKPAMTTSGRRTALVVGIAVPLLALGLYWQIGAPQLSDQPHAGAQMAGDMGDLVATLKQRLEQNPEDVEGWKLLGRSMLFMERFDEAAQAISRAVALTKSNPDPELLAEYADTLAFAQGGSLEGQPIQLVEQALKLNPDTPRALWLAGVHAYDQRDIPKALKQWRHLLSLISPEDEMAATVRATIAEAEAASGAAPAASSATAIQLKLVLDEKLADKVGPNDTLFVFARPMNGQKMPVAGLRRAAGGFPLNVTLSDAEVMLAGQSLADYERVEIVARISKSGQTMAQPGDLEGKTNVTVGDKKAATVRITAIVP